MKEKTQTFPNVEWHRRMRAHRADPINNPKPGPNPVRKITTYEPGPGEQPQAPWDRIEGGELPIAKVRVTCKYQAKLLGLLP